MMRYCEVKNCGKIDVFMMTRVCNANFASVDEVVDEVFNEVFYKLFIPINYSFN